MQIYDFMHPVKVFEENPLTRAFVSKENTKIENYG